MTANQTRSLGSKSTPNKNLSEPDVSVPSLTLSGPCLNQRVAVGLSLFAHLSHVSHFSNRPHPCNPPIPRPVLRSLSEGGLLSVRFASSGSDQEFPNFFEFTLRNPLIYRVLTLSNLNKQFFSRVEMLALRAFPPSVQRAFPSRTLVSLRNANLQCSIPNEYSYEKTIASTRTRQPH
jgi:hypothetical protein